MIFNDLYIDRFGFLNVTAKNIKPIWVGFILYNNLYHNWTVENNFYYTVDFSGNPTQIPDLVLGLALATDVSFLKYISTFLLIDDRREFLKMAVKSEFQKMIYEIHLDVD